MLQISDVTPELSELMGLKPIKVANTNYKEWKKAFLVGLDGVTYGTLSFRNNAFYSIKLYTSSYIDNVMPYHKVNARIIWVLESKRAMPEGLFEEVIERAREISRKNLEVQERWRTENPIKVISGKKPRRRKALQGKNVILLAFDLLRKETLYDRPIEKDNTVYTVEEFKQMVDTRLFIDYDGFGYPAKNNFINTKIFIQPSIIEKIPPEATHIVWFNR